MIFSESVSELLILAFAIPSGAKRLRQRSEIKNLNFAALSLRDALRCVQDAKNPHNGLFFKKKKRAEARRKGGFKNLSP